jgi:hypothetical protein
MKKFYFCVFAMALAIAAKAQAPPNYGHPVNPKYAYQLAWTKEKFRGDDAPYRAVRRRITEALQAGKPSAEMIARYKNEYQQKPADTMKIFAWACAVVLPRILRHEEPDLQFLMRAYEKSKPPFTYESLRMRYLAEKQYTQNDYLTALGERLIAQNKDDFDLLFDLWKDTGANVPGAKEKSLGYARRMIELKPNLGAGYGCMADRYYIYWAMCGEHLEDARQALYWNEEYLKHEKRTAPRYEAGREDARLTIAKLQKWFAQQKK